MTESADFVSDLIDLTQMSLAELRSAKSRAILSRHSHAWLRRWKSCRCHRRIPGRHLELIGQTRISISVASGRWLGSRAVSAICPKVAQPM